MNFKFICLISIFLPLSAFSRGEDARPQTLGGVKVDKDPFFNVKKSNGTRGDREKALQMMAELGFDVGGKKQKKQIKHKAIPKGTK